MKKLDKQLARLRMAHGKVGIRIWNPDTIICEQRGVYPYKDLGYGRTAREAIQNALKFNWVPGQAVGFWINRKPNPSDNTINEVIPKFGDVEAKYPHHKTPLWWKIPKKSVFYQEHRVKLTPSGKR